MPEVLYRRFISRDYLQDHSHILAIFGDNVTGRGFGGQAKEMRGEPNAVGIPTKKKPSWDDDAYFTDQDIPFFRAQLIPPFRRLQNHRKKNGLILCPMAGIGTDRADLPNRAPKCFVLLKTMLSHLDIYPPDWKD